MTGAEFDCLQKESYYRYVLRKAERHIAENLINTG